jgi:hypothetical protein
MRDGHTLVQWRIGLERSLGAYNQWLLTGSLSWSLSRQEQTMLVQQVSLDSQFRALSNRCTSLNLALSNDRVAIMSQLDIGSSSLEWNHLLLQSSITVRATKDLNLYVRTELQSSQSVDNGLLAIKALEWWIQGRINIWSTSIPITWSIAYDIWLKRFIPSFSISKAF